MHSYDDILSRADFHFNQADKETKRAAWWAAAFKWTIPILSAIVTAIVSGGLIIFGNDLKFLGVWAGLILTILTIANSIAKPAEAFRIAANYANRFEKF